LLISIYSGRRESVNTEKEKGERKIRIRTGPLGRSESQKTKPYQKWRDDSIKCREKGQYAYPYGCKEKGEKEEEEGVEFPDFEEAKWRPFSVC